MKKNIRFKFNLHFQWPFSYILIWPFTKMEKVFKNRKIMVGIGVAIIAIAITVFLFMNKGSVTKEDWYSISLGMSVEEVEKTLGKPKSSTDDNATISENVYSSYKKMYEFTLTLTNNDLERRLDQLNEVYLASEADKNVKEYVYTVKRDDGKNDSQIYFVGGAVKYINRAEEE